MRSTSSALAPRIEHHLQGAELLQRLVVQLTGPARALLVGGSHGVAQALVAHGLCGGDRDGGTRRKGAEQVLVLGVEGGSVAHPVEGDQ